MHKVEYKALRNGKEVQGVYCYDGPGCWRDAQKALRLKLKKEGVTVAWVDANKMFGQEKCENTEWEIKKEDT